MSEPVDAEMLAALRRERSAAAPREARARVAGRLASLLPGVAIATATGAAHPSGVPGAGSVVGVGIKGVRALVAAALVVGGVAGAGLHATLAPVAPPRVIYVDRPTPALALTPAPAPAPAPALALAPALAPAPALASGLAPASAPRAPAAQLDAERALLDEARGALSHGDAPLAVDVLLRHERTYPKPMLAEERDALMVQALVRAGRYDEARARADAFRRRSPGSLFMTAVDGAIGSIP